LSIALGPNAIQQLETILAETRLKGIALASARLGQPTTVAAIGTDAAGIPLREDSLFAVASITKIATALAVLRLVDRGELALDDPLQRHLPEAVAAAHQGVTIRRLLSHTSGLPMDLSPRMAVYAPGLAWPTLAEGCIQTPLQQPPCSRVQYSNVGYGLLAVVVERKTGTDFTMALRHLVLDPLGIEGYLGETPPRPWVAVAGVRGTHSKTPLEPFNSVFWHSLAMPWAGLLTTPAGALTLVRCLLEPPAGFLSPDLVAEARRNQTDDLDGGFVRPLLWSPCPWGLGPELRGRKQPHWAPAPPAISTESFGHSGASGCLVWADPASGISWAILGTRTADSGWLLRRGSAIAEMILGSATE